MYYTHTTYYVVRKFYYMTSRTIIHELQKLRSTYPCNVYVKMHVRKMGSLARFAHEFS